MQSRDDFPDEFASIFPHSNTFLLPLDKFNFFFNQRVCRLPVYFIEKVDVLSGRIVMEGKNRLLDCFVGNTETSTVVPLLDGSPPSDFKVLFRSFLSKNWKHLRPVQRIWISVRKKTLEVRSCLKIGRGCLDVRRITASPFLLASTRTLLTI